MAKSITNKLNGTLMLNSKTITRATACEITPAGNGQYAVTIRTVLSDQPPEMFVEDVKGKVHITYCHKQLPDIHLEANFLDFGIQDEKDECIMSLFFRATAEKSPVVEVTKPSIVLVK